MLCRPRPRLGRAAAGACPAVRPGRVRLPAPLLPARMAATRSLSPAQIILMSSIAGIRGSAPPGNGALGRAARRARPARRASPA